MLVEAPSDSPQLRRTELDPGFTSTHRDSQTRQYHALHLVTPATAWVRVDD